MPKKANKSKRPKDKYYHLAKEQGYRARSAFKLIQLNKKYDFLAHAHTCVDLCAAPGGWLQVAAKYMPSQSTIIGVDLMPIKPIRGVITHVEDITTPDCRNVLKRDLGGKLADVVLHDGAPNVGQNWRKDAFTQSELVLCSLKLATEFLRPKGMFITKVFRSADYNSLLWVFNQFFEKVEATKPHSSRNASAEIFVVCKEYKAPDKIDPRLLDSRFVFKEIDETTGTSTGVAGGGGGQTLTVFDKRASMHNKRQREGYDESLGVLLTKAMSITSFLASDNPVRVITDASSLHFDPAAVTAGVADHALTTGEIKACCQDLKVLGKKEFKGLLRWRYMMRKAFPTLVAGAQEVELSGSEGDESDEEDEEDAESEESEDSDAEDLKHLSAEAQAELRRRHKEKKKDAKKRNKALRRQQLGMNLRSVDLLDTDNTLFNLRDIKRLASKAAGAGADVDGLDDIRDVDLDHDVAMSNTMATADTEENDGFEETNEVELANELDADDLLDDAADGDLALRFRQHDQASRMEDMEEDFDRAYAQYLSKKNTKEAELKESSAKGEGPSKGLKLTRMQKLKQQAILTEAALAGQLDAEHQKYLKLLAGVRNSVGRSAVAAEANAVNDMPVAQLTGVKRKRDGALAEVDVENIYDDGDDDDDEESYEEEDDGIEGHNFSRGISAEVRANRWFSNPIFRETDGDSDMVPTKASKKPTSWSDSEDDTRVNDKDEDKGWLAGMPKSDRDKRKEKLKKQKSQDAKVAKKAAGEDIQVVGGIGADLDDADAEFERVTRRAAGEALGQDSGDEDDETDEEDDDERRNKELIRKGMGRAVKGGPAVDQDSGIEIVRAGEDKADLSDSDDSDTDSDASSHDPRLDQYDSDTHAEMLALGKMLKKHTSAKKLLDASYNRYAFDDTGLPGWFEADESRHFRPTLPVSKAEVEAIKLKFRDIAARPVARVAEARARKRRRVEIKMQKAKKQAENVMESEELQGHSRTKALARIYRGQEQRKPKTTHVVTSSSGNHGNKLGKAKRGGGPVRMVDSRLKKDAKAMKRVAKARGKPSSRGRSASRGRR